ncbi:MAG: hypothetical protein WCK07_17805, partial [Betaproteobacteria bacterium]
CDDGVITPASAGYCREAFTVLTNFSDDALVGALSVELGLFFYAIIATVFSHYRWCWCWCWSWPRP